MCVFKKKIKYITKPAHWVGHSKLESPDIYEFFNRTPTFDEKQASVTMNTEEEETTAKNSTDDVDENSQENKRIHKNREKIVTIEEERKTLEYQETMNLDI